MPYLYSLTCQFCLLVEEVVLMAGAEGLILAKQAQARAQLPKSQDSFLKRIDHKTKTAVLRAGVFLTMLPLVAYAIGCGHQVLLNRTLTRGQSAQAKTQDGKTVRVTLKEIGFVFSRGDVAELRIEEISADGKVVRTEEGPYNRGWYVLGGDYIVECDSIQTAGASARVQLKK